MSDNHCKFCEESSIKCFLCREYSCTFCREFCYSCDEYFCKKCYKGDCKHNVRCIICEKISSKECTTKCEDTFSSYVCHNHAIPCCHDCQVVVEELRTCTICKKEFCEICCGSCLCGDYHCNKCTPSCANCGSSRGCPNIKKCGDCGVKPCFNCTCACSECENKICCQHVFRCDKCGLINKGNLSIKFTLYGCYNCGTLC